MSKRTSNFEFWLFRKLLARFCTIDLDQHDSFQFTAKRTKFYVTISLAPSPGTEDKHYRSVNV